MTPLDKNPNQHPSVQGEVALTDPLPVGQVLSGVLETIRARQSAERGRKPRIDPGTAELVINEARVVLADPTSTESQRSDAQRRIDNARSSQAQPADGSAG